MSEQTAVPEPIEARTLTLERIIDATPDKVFRAWTTPELIKLWFAPKPWSVSAADIDLRPGGKANITMRSPEGVDYPNDGIYLEIVPGRKVVSTDAFREGWEPAGAPFMVSTISFEEAPGGKTKYTAQVQHWSAAACQKHEQMGFQSGWGQCADQLNELVKTL